MSRRPIAFCSFRSNRICCIAIGLLLTPLSNAGIWKGPCAVLNGTFQNLGVIKEGARAGQSTTIKWTVFRGAKGTTLEIVQRESERDGITLISLESLDEHSISVVGTTADGVSTDPYVLGSTATWNCVGGTFVRSESGELGGEANSGDVMERLVLRVDESGNLVHEHYQTIQRRSALLFGMKIGAPEITRRTYVFPRLAR
jgi:hypothetical protein